MPTSMETGLALLAAVVAATVVGGVLPLRFERHSRLFLSFSAGTLVALALLELIPHGLHGAEEPHTRLLLVLASFLVTMLADKLHILHPHEHPQISLCPAEDHVHSPLAVPGAIGLLIHSAVDGFALAAAQRESLAAVLAVGLALSAHKLADGLTTVSLLLSRHHRGPAIAMLAGNALLLVVGFSVGMVVPLQEHHLASLLLVMAGFFLYLGASDLLPSVSHPRCRKRDALATAVGMAAVAAVSLLAHR